MVLAAVLRLGEDAYGAAIVREIHGSTGRSVANGSLYITLDRLERKGLIESRMGEPNARRGGRPKRFVHVTDRGLEAVRNVREAMLSLWRGIEDRLERPEGSK